MEPVKLQVRAAVSFVLSLRPAGAVTQLRRLHGEVVLPARPDIVEFGANTGLYTIVGARVPNVVR
jgi:hypothetical protein